MIIWSVSWSKFKDEGPTWFESRDDAKKFIDTCMSADIDGIPFITSHIVQNTNEVVQLLNNREMK